MTYVVINETRRQDVWFLDSGNSNHMCGDKIMFCDLNESFRQIMKLGNNARITVLGKGNVRLKVYSCGERGVLCAKIKKQPLEYWTIARKRSGYSYSTWEM